MLQGSVAAVRDKHAAAESRRESRVVPRLPPSRGEGTVPWAGVAAWGSSWQWEQWQEQCASEVERSSSNQAERVSSSLLQLAPGRQFQLLLESPVTVSQFSSLAIPVPLI